MVIKVMAKIPEIVIRREGADPLHRSLVIRETKVVSEHHGILVFIQLIAKIKFTLSHELFNIRVIFQ